MIVLWLSNHVHIHLSPYCDALPHRIKMFIFTAITETLDSLDLISWIKLYTEVTLDFIRKKGKQPTQKPDTRRK